MTHRPEITLVASNNSQLQFRIESRSASETIFVVNVDSKWLQASAEATTYVNGPPSLLFREVAADWRGWEGEKTWSDLEGRVHLAATSDSTGHITLRVELTGPNYHDLAKVRLVFEAGQLEKIAVRISKLFESAT